MSLPLHCYEHIPVGTESSRFIVVLRIVYPFQL